MRNQFCEWVLVEAQQNPKLIFLTGDVGFNALEKIQDEMGSRFINMGVAEQNMISVAAGLAYDGWQVLCYSIAPFVVHRPAEQIKIDLGLHKSNVKIIGNGGGYGYGIMGPTHHAIEDLALMSSLQNVKCFIPHSEEDVENTCKAMMSFLGPSYLRLNLGSEKNLFQSPKFQSVRRIYGVSASELVLVTIGSMAQVAVQAVQSSLVKAQVFSVSELPLSELSPDLTDSLKNCKKLIVLEEHVARGGLGEHLSWHMMRQGIAVPEFIHRHAVGYPDGLYGSQHYHQKISGLSVESVQSLLL